MISRRMTTRASDIYDVPIANQVCSKQSSRALLLTDRMRGEIERDNHCVVVLGIYCTPIAM